MAKPDYSNEPKPQISDDLLSFIKENELRWWIVRASRKDIREAMKLFCQVSLKPKQFARVLFWYCEIYGKWKRKPETKNRDLDEAGWTKLKTVVESLKNHLGMVKGVDEASVVVRSKIATNRHLLDGLTNRFKYWDR